MCVTISTADTSEHAVLSLSLRLPARESRIKRYEDHVTQLESQMEGESGEQKRLEAKFERTDESCRDKWDSFIHRMKNKASTHEHTHEHTHTHS